jgi:1,2-diacylglycerol 3-beta-galactosyltransferase
VTTQPRLVHVPLATATAAVVGARIGAAYAAYDPDLVVSVHPLMQHVPLRVLRARVRAGLQAAATAFATVVTDLTTCHNTWFHAGVDRCYVATEETRAQALALGLAEAQVRLFGLPIRPAFARRFPPKRRLRGALGMHPAAPAVLLVGGGEGMGPVEATVEALAARVGAGCQLVVVCGRNQGLVDRLNAK